MNEDSNTSRGKELVQGHITRQHSSLGVNPDGLTPPLIALTSLLPEAVIDNRGRGGQLLETFLIVITCEGDKEGGSWHLVSRGSGR